MKTNILLVLMLLIATGCSTIRSDPAKKPIGVPQEIVIESSKSFIEAGRLYEKAGKIYAHASVKQDVVVSEKTLYEYHRKEIIRPDGIVGFVYEVTDSITLDILPDDYEKDYGKERKFEVSEPRNVRRVVQQAEVELWVEFLSRSGRVVKRNSLTGFTSEDGRVDFDVSSYIVEADNNMSVRDLVFEFLGYNMTGDSFRVTGPELQERFRKALSL